MGRRLPHIETMDGADTNRPLRCRHGTARHATSAEHGASSDDGRRQDQDQISGWRGDRTRTSGAAAGPGPPARRQDQDQLPAAGPGPRPTASSRTRTRTTGRRGGRIMITGRRRVAAGPDRHTSAEPVPAIGRHPMALPLSSTACSPGAGRAASSDRLNWPAAAACSPAADPGDGSGSESHRLRIHEQQNSKVSNGKIRYVKQTEILTRAGSCNSCKRVRTSRFHELHESKFPFVLRIEFIPVRNFRILLLMYPGSSSTVRRPSPACR